MENNGKLARDGLKRISYRGKDGEGFMDESFGTVGHCLHALVSKVPQPFEEDDFIFLTNCEIYNWKSIARKDTKKEETLGLIESRNDAEALFHHLLESRDLDESLKDVDGVYAFAMWNTKINKVFLARDLLGVKPLWYYYEPVEGAFAFASERKSLISQGLENAYIKELNPRKMLVYDVDKFELNEYEREFFKVKNNNDSEEEIIKKTEELLLNAIKKRIPQNRKVGILFSGGIDSTFIALILKKLNISFTCYSAGLKEVGLKDAQDLEWAKRVAKELDLNLNIKEISLKEVPEYLKTILPLIEDNNVVKAGVALPFYLAGEQAKKDGVKILFSGLGSEEIFAGYERHKKSLKINEECLSGLRKIYERDLYRDDVITMIHTIELRLPFLDKKLVEYALSIPESLKLNDERNKIILRVIAKKLGLNEEFAERKKKAAQYGSNFDKAIQKLANKQKLNKAQYLKQFYDKGNVRLASLLSTGKDSVLATQIMIDQNYEISCFITINIDNPDSYMYHSPNTTLARLQAEAADIPLIVKTTKGEKEKELEELKEAIKEAVNKYKIEGIVNGALFSNYQRERIEKICDEIGIKCFSPLWHMEQRKEVELLIERDFEFFMVKIAAEGLNKSWLGKPITKIELNKLIELNKKIGFHIAGEGGEYESFVLNCPFFKKKIVIERSYVSEDGVVATLNIEKANLT